VENVDNFSVTVDVTNTGDETLKLYTDPRGVLSTFPVRVVPLLFRPAFVLRSIESCDLILFYRKIRSRLLLRMEGKILNSRDPESSMASLSPRISSRWNQA
jgi:hypothetical protein